MLSIKKYVALSLWKGVKAFFARHAFHPLFQLKLPAIILFMLLICSPLPITTAMAMEMIPVEGEPLALALDEAGGRLFSLNFFNKTIAVIDEKKLKVVKTIELGKRINRNVGTNAILYDQALNQLFVSTGNGEVLIFNGSSLELTGEIAIDKFIPDLASDGNYLYLLDWSGNIHRYKGEVEDSIINHGVTGSPYMHFGANRRIYLSSGQKGLLVIDSEKGGLLKRIEINALSAAASSSKYVFVAGPGKLYIINRGSAQVEKALSMDYGNFAGLGIVYSEAGDRVYVVTENGTVSAADPETGKVLEKIEVCRSAKALAFNEKRGRLYVACPSDNTIAVVN